jgi:hypothetical protein
MSAGPHSTAHADPAQPRVKPPKPYPEFPLYAHVAGVWAKKIRGRAHYFGPWEDPDGALAEYVDQTDDLHAGPRPKERAGAADVKALANAFLAHKQERVDNAELSPHT